MGAGGIGFDVAEFLTQAGPSSRGTRGVQRRVGIDTTYAAAGGIRRAAPERPARQVALLQRKETKVGAGLGKTTGWIHRTQLKHRGVAMVPGVVYGGSTTSACTCPSAASARSSSATPSCSAPVRNRNASCTMRSRRRASMSA